MSNVMMEQFHYLYKMKKLLSRRNLLLLKKF